MKHSTEFNKTVDSGKELGGVLVEGSREFSVIMARKPYT